MIKQLIAFCLGVQYAWLAYKHNRQSKPFLVGIPGQVLGEEMLNFTMHRVLTNEKKSFPSPK